MTGLTIDPGGLSTGGGLSFGTGLSLGVGLEQSGSWYSSPTWWSSDGDKPEVILDFNEGLYAIPTLGQELITDPELDNPSAWTAGTGWTVAGGVATKTSGTGSYLALTGSTVVVGAVYCITYTVATRSAGATVPSIGNVDGSTASAAAATYTNYIVASATTTVGGAGLNIYANSAFVGTISRITAQQVSLGASLTSPVLRPATVAESITVSATRSGASSSFVGSNGFMQYLATSDVPRFTWLGGKRRLVVEPAATNNMLRSNEFGTAPWAAPSVTLSSGPVLAPDGSVATKLVYNNGAIGYLVQAKTFVAGTPSTQSIFVYAAGRSTFFILSPNAVFGGAGANAACTFDINTNTVTPKRSEVTGYIENYGGGWYRCVSSFTPTSSVAAEVQYCRAVTNGDGVVGMYVFGSQQENTAFATSYIPTAGSTVTRAAEVVTGSPAVTALMRRATGTNVTRYYQQDDPVLAPARQTLWSMNLDGGNSRMSIRKAAGSSTESPQGAVGNGTTVSSLTPGSGLGANAAESVGVAVAWSASNSRMGLKSVITGASDGVAWDAAANSASVLYIGRNSDGSTPSSMLVDQIVLYPVRVSNAALPGLAVAAT